VSDLVSDWRISAMAWVKELPAAARAAHRMVLDCFERAVRDDERAALLAQRDRYEAALREIAGMKATRYAEVNVMQAVAWEALAAAQEEAT
jgi:hypothetical protein